MSWGDESKEASKLLAILGQVLSFQSGNLQIILMVQKSLVGFLNVSHYLESIGSSTIFLGNWIAVFRG